MPIIKWTDSFSVNIVEIDAQHKKLVEMINRLYDAMKVGKSKDVMGEILDNLISYTETHFKTEEKYFDLYRYPEKETHKAEHEKFTEIVTKFKKDFDSGNAIISIEVMNFLKEWLTNHINGSDKRYTKCFNDHGLK
ncbi:bacteriohemerythrin [Methanosarcina sp. T3]|uniref:bacteriohemerythrin n=1 Tax=Methanosarcina sp. T3 TaxID=3439062 RepID=UPI003F8705CB